MIAGYSRASKTSSTQASAKLLVASPLGAAAAGQAAIAVTTRRSSAAERARSFASRVAWSRLRSLMARSRRALTSPKRGKRSATRVAWRSGSTAAATRARSTARNRRSRNDEASHFGRGGSLRCPPGAAPDATDGAGPRAGFGAQPSDTPHSHTARVRAIEVRSTGFGRNVSRRGVEKPSEMTIPATCLC
jgi:hypothetical protein